ncbi:uncharacterized protein LOC110028883 isoform X2 [Phalaenopsis equestris]|uniref:uncharacterized protein LOC110028883 isoform X2 n=1 Tax=Phalaenopsis equestris TaxID=78828 RepID=UPI0009E1DD39|nr:uncharacterized protein LOC110028883 isoform X2 [Phalaenopsis equestris]
MKDRREWRGDTLSHRFGRSRSPAMRQQRPQAMPHRSFDRRSSSRELRQDHPLRRSDHGKEIIYNHSPLPHHRYRLPSPPTSSRDDDFRFQHEYLLPEHNSSNPSWKTSQSIKDREFIIQINEDLPPSSLDMAEQGMLRQNSTLTGERTSRFIYSDQNSDTMRCRGGGFGMGMQEVELHSYNDGHRGPHDNMDGRRMHSSDFSIPNLPSSQLRPFSSTSSSGILKEEVKGLHRSPVSDGLAYGIGRHPNDPLEHYPYHQIPKSDPLRPIPLDMSQTHDYDELHPRGLDDHRPRVQDETYKKIPSVSLSNFRDPTSSTILDYPGDWMDKDVSSNRNLIQRTFSDCHHDLNRGVSHNYDDMRTTQELLTYSGDWQGGLRVKSSQDYERIPFDESRTPERDFFSSSHRAEHRNSKPLISDHGLDEHRLSMSAHDMSHMDVLRDYDLERMERRNHSIVEDIDESHSRVLFKNERRYFNESDEILRDYDLERMGRRNHNIVEDLHESHSRVLFMNDRRSFNVSDEMWVTEERSEPSLSKSRLMKHSRYGKVSGGISKSDAFMLSSGASSMHAERDLNINLKRRLKHTRSDFHTRYVSERRPDLLRSHKNWKRGIQDRLGAQGGGPYDNHANVVKNDPSEDSEEFKQQVHKAFLRYSKLFYETRQNQRIYKNQGSSYSLLCSVCGSTSKEFLDTNSLVTHSYHSLKKGLKTEHLGFHKALCVLLGWNWRVPPDKSRAYQSMPVADAKAMRDDLILWPPLVIIHNILIGDNSGTKDAKVVTLESLEKKLRALLNRDRIVIFLETAIPQLFSHSRNKQTVSFPTTTF